MLITLDLSSTPTTLNSFPTGDISAVMRDLQEVFVVHPEVCCIFFHADCHSDIKNNDIIGTCQNIIASNVLLALLSVYILLIWGFNIVSFKWWIHKMKDNKVARSLLACSLSLADGLIGVHLMILIIVHAIHQNDVGYVALRWKESVLCKVIGIIIMMSIEASFITTTLIAIDRFLCLVVRPFEQEGLSTAAAICTLILSYCLSITFTVLAALYSTKSIATSACILLGESLSMIFSIIYLIFNTVLFIVLVALYLALIIKVVKSSKIKKSQDMSGQICKRLGAVIVTTFVPWFLVTILALLSLVGFPPPAFLESIMGLVLFPLNALLNPLINTITTREFQEDLSVKKEVNDKVKDNNIQKKSKCPSWIINVFNACFFTKVAYSVREKLHEEGFMRDRGSAQAADMGHEKQARGQKVLFTK
jgi:hypothetical protein